MIASLRRAAGEPGERVDRSSREASALLIGPALELRRILQKEPVQKRPAVEAGGGLEVLGLQRAVERIHIGRDDGGVQAQGLPALEQRFVADLASLSVQELVEHVPSALGVGFGPEKRQQLVPAQAG